MVGHDQTIALLLEYEANLTHYRPNDTKVE